MRTDTQRLDWILAALDSGNGEPLERLQAAYTLELRGRTAIDAAMGAKIVEPGEPMPELTAIDLAIAEVGRIRNVKGFSEERDDEYVKGELAKAAMAYFDTQWGDGWPWLRESFHPSPDDRKKELTKGIALALCELDRVIRAERREPVTMGIDLTSGIDQCIVDGVLPPQPREFKVGDRVTVPDYDGNPDDRRVGEFGGMAPLTGYAQVRLDGRSYWLYFPSGGLEHADD